MAAFEFAALTAKNDPTPETPQAVQSEQTQEARTAVTYTDAGQAPATQKNGLRGLLPHAKGGFTTWLVIITFLLLAFWFHSHSQGSSVSVTTTVKEAVTGE